MRRTRSARGLVGSKFSRKLTRLIVSQMRRAVARASLSEILVGPAHENDGTLNLFGALRTSMATTGYETLKEFQKAEVMVAPSLQTEGKSLQRAQGIGMGR